MKKAGQKKDRKQARQAILEAAIKAFAKTSYTASSIRMIAAEGSFSHALIRYYFPTKADLFDAVAKVICDDTIQASNQALAAVKTMNRPEGFARYVEQLIAFSRQKPWVFRIILLNLSAETVETFPGQHRFVETVESIREDLIRTLKFKAPHDDICRFTDSLNALLFYYLGTPESAAWLLRLDPDSEAYYEWVAKTLVNIFLPGLEDLFTGGGRSGLQ